MYIYGKNVVKEALLNNKKINKAYLCKDFSDKNIISDLQKRNICIDYVTKFELDKLENGNHQGIILSVPEFEYSSLDQLLVSDKPFLVILDHLEDPHNFGAIIRTCEALGIDAIIIPNDRNVGVNATVVKTSAGAIYNMPIIRVVNLATTIKKLKDMGYWVVGTDMDGTDYTRIDYNCPICLIIGNEGHGMSKIITDNCDYIASIPMMGKINSLNASVSCGIVLAQIVNSRNFNGK